MAVVGATGSGKTTLAKLLTRLADPTDGPHPRRRRRPARRCAIASLRVDARDGAPGGASSSTPRSSTTSASPARRPTDDEVRLAFVELGLEEWLDALPDGLDTKVGERGEHLSVGERQLVALARAYVANPTCLVLDEATSAVDAVTETRLARALESLARGRTSITIAHRLSTAERADRVLVFDHGRLVEQGTHDELLARRRRLRRPARELDGASHRDADST